MKVSVIIPNYNGVKFLDDCLLSLREQSFNDFEVILVDNNSCDNSVELVKTNYPEVKIISLDKNYGFSKAVNEGILLSKSDYTILLNNDTKVEKDFVKNLYESIKNKKKAFSVASKMITMNNKNILDSAGDLYTVIGWGINKGSGRNINSYNKPSSIFSSCAGACIYKKSVFNKIGLFDENHFAYLEDIDIGWRALRSGFRNYYEPSAICYHVGSGSSGSKYNEFKVSLSSRNSIYINYKNMTLLQKIINFLPLCLGFFVKYLFFVKKKYGKTYINGIMIGLKTKRKLTRPKYQLSHILDYIYIEVQLLKNLLLYVIDWIKRKI